MATVRLTQELRDSIERNARDGIKARESAAHTRYSEMIDREQLKLDVVEVLLEQNGLSREMFDAIPDGWIPTRETVSFGRLNEYPANHLIGVVQFDPPLRVPYSLGGADRYRSLNLSDPRFLPCVEIVREYDAQVKALADERDQVIGALQALFNKCSTLKQALELFPSLEKLVPPDAMARHNEKTEKRMKAEITADGVNLDVLSVSLVRNRIHTAV